MVRDPMGGVPCLLHCLHTHCFILIGPPSLPRNVRVTSRNSDSITLEWDPPEDLGGRTDTTYVLRYQEVGSTTSPTFAIRVNITTATITGVCVCVCVCVCVSECTSLCVCDVPLTVTLYGLRYFLCLLSNQHIGWPKPPPPSRCPHPYELRFYVLSLYLLLSFNAVSTSLLWPDLPPAVPWAISNDLM